MRKEVRKEKKRSRLIKRLVKKLKFLGKHKSRRTNSVYIGPRNIRRNKCRSIIKKDGLSKVNKHMKYYWEDVQAGAYKL